MQLKIPFWRSIRFTYTVILLVGVICFIAATLLIRADRDRQNQLIYNDRKAERQQSLDVVVELDSQSLKDLANENTYWDEMVSFISDPKSESSLVFEKEVIASQLDVYNATATWTYNTNFELTSNTNVFESDLKDTQLNLTADNIRTIFAVGPEAHFYTKTEAGLLEVWGATVHPSSDKDHKTAPLGYYFTSRIIDSSYTALIAKHSSDRVEILSADKVNSRQTDFEPSEGKIAFYKDLRDFNGALVGQLYIEYDSVTIGRVVRSFNRLAVITIIGYVILAITVYVIFGRLIIRPLSKLYSGLSTNRAEPLEPLVRQQTEFGRIAELILSSFRQRDELASVLKQQASTQQALEKRSKELEHTNSLMVNRELRMIELKKQIAELKKAQKDQNEQ